MNESSVPTPYAVHCLGIDPEIGAGPCEGGKKIYLTEKNYKEQMNFPDRGWKCPRCNAYASWDDENYEKMLGIS